MKNRLKQHPPAYDLISKYRKCLMGAAIISILIFHYTEDCIKEGMLVGSFIRRYYKYISSSGVDIFQVLSGYGLYYSMKRAPGRRLRDFYKHRFMKILIPYLLIAVPALFWRDLLLEGRTVGYYISDIFFVTFFREGRLWFWYIALICFCYLIFPWLFSAVDDSRDDITAQFRTLSLFCLITVIALLFSVQSPKLHGRINIAWLRLVPFVLGIYLGRAGYAHKKIPLGIVALFACSIFLLPLINTSQLMVRRYILMFFGVFQLLLIVLVMEYSPIGKVKPFIKMVETFGGYTLELYLTHVMVRGVFQLVGHPCSVPRNEAAMLLISFALTFVINRITRWIIAAVEKAVTK